MTKRNHPELETITRKPSFAVIVRHYAEALLMVVVATAIGLLIAPRWGTYAVDLLYLPPVLAAAILYGFRPAMTAALASAMAYNFFFAEPYYSLRMNRPADILTVVILFIVAAVTSRLAAQMRSQAALAVANAKRNATIAGLAGRLLPCIAPEQIAKVATSEIATLFDCNAALLIDSINTRALAVMPTTAPLTPVEFIVAASVIAEGKIAGRGSQRLTPCEWLFFPVKSGDAILAAFGVVRNDGRSPIPPEGQLLFDNLIDQVALALERARLEASARDIERLRERDRLRDALLSSVGHDLRTPLTAVSAAAAQLDISQDANLVGTIRSEASKLERYITNLLDMARIEAGTIRISEEPIDLVDSVSAAVRDLRKELGAVRVGVEFADELPLVRGDARLLHHCLINLISNAARLSPTGGRIAISGQAEKGGVCLSVADEGPGISADMPDIAFDSFEQISGSDSSGGSGLGLSIVRAFAEAMRVEVSAYNRNGGSGAIFALHFPAALIIPETVDTDDAS